MNQKTDAIVIQAEEDENTPTRISFFSPRLPSVTEAVLRLIAAYLAVLGNYMWAHPDLAFSSPTYGLSLVKTGVLTLIVFALFTLLDFFVNRFLKLDGWLLLFTALSYGTILSFRAKSENTALAAALLGCFAIVYLIKHDLIPLPKIEGWTESLSKGVSVTLLVGLFALCALYIGAVTCIRYLIYAAPNFDFGLFVNMFHNMKETGLPNITSERDGLLSHFAVHFSPIYYLLLPAYMIFPSALTLQIGQAVVVAAGVFPLYRIVRRLGQSRAVALGFSAAYILYPALSGSCMYDIHENCFLAPLLLYTFYFALSEKKIPTLIFALLTCLVKEDAPVYIAFLGIYLLFAYKGRKKFFGIGVTALAITYFLGVSAYLAAYGEGVMAWRYSEYATDGGLLSVIVNVVRNPGLVLYRAFNAEKIPYIIQTLVPLCFLPFMTKKPERLVLLGPYILINLMPSYQYQHDIYFQYNFGSFAFLIFAAALNFTDLEVKTRKYALPCLLCASLFLFSGTTYSNKYHYLTRLDDSDDLRAEMQEAIDLIPEDASLASSTFILAHVAYRDVVYAMDTTHMAECEYAIVDLRYGREIDDNPYKLDYLWFEAQGWETVIFTEGTVAVYKNPAPRSPENAEK